MKLVSTVYTRTATRLVQVLLLLWVLLPGYRSLADDAHDRPTKPPVVAKRPTVDRSFVRANLPERKFQKAPETADRLSTTSSNMAVLDSDGDGVPDDIDLDDDNDGIPDSIESGFACVGGDGKINYKTWTLAELTSSNAFFTSTTLHRNSPTGTIKYGDFPDFTASAATASGTVPVVFGQTPWVDVANGGNDPNDGNFTQIEGFISLPCYSTSLKIRTLASGSPASVGTVRETFTTLHLALDASGNPTFNTTDLKEISYQKVDYNGNIVNSTDYTFTNTTSSGRWVRFGDAISDGADFYGAIIQWNVDGTGWVNVPESAFSSTSTGLIAGCAYLDTDGDGIVNSLDLDSDNDGCSDAYEAGATTSKTADFQFSAASVGANGLTNLKETAADNGILNYTPTYTQFALSAFLNACADSDGDSISDLVDLDDDNDGILDAVEAPSCYYTATEANTIQAISSKYPASEPFQELYDGLTTKVFNFPASTMVVGDAIFTIEYPTHVELTSVTVSDNITSIAATRARLDGSTDGVTWLELTSTDVSLSTSPVVFTVNTNAGEYQYYRIRNTVGGNLTTGNTIGEITSVLDASYIPSLHPESTCAADTDGDGIVNNLDLDSDGDGCADAIEGAGTFKVGNITPAGALTGTVSLATATYGVPTQAVPGQAIGTSQNAAVQDADCPQTDTDGDGVADIDDLDDDNDGILDTVEDPACQKIVNGAGGLNTGWTITGNITEATGFFAFNYNGTTPNGVMSQTVTAVPNQRLQLTFTAEVFGSTAGTVGTRADIIQGGIVIATKTVTKNQGGASTAESLSFTPGPGAFTVRFTDVSASTNDIDFILKNVSLLAACGLDTDGDGIINSLDLDSDGDGCADAIEGGAVFTTANLVTSTMPGGNSGTGYTGTSTTPVKQNLGNVVGNTVTTMGVPTTASTGQTIGYSQNASVNGCLDTDGDGIPDLDDLDDDNDGILDTDEDANCEKIINGSGANGFTGWTKTGNVFANGVQFSFNYNDTTPNGVMSQVITTVPNQSLNLKFDAVGWGGNTAGNVSVRVDVLTGSTVIATRTIVKTFGVPWTNETLGFLPTTTQTTVRFTDLSTVTSSFDFVISGISVVGPCGADTDGDGIPNSLDLDSDGDGCADAIEGGAAFTTSNLVSSTMAGGSTNVKTNLGNTVGTTAATMGVPTIAGFGQSTGYSQNSAVNGCLDTDGDGIPDLDDLDDDNDGILDTDEDANCEKIINGSGANGFTGWTKTGNVFANGVQFSFNYNDTTPDGVMSQVITTVPNQGLNLKFDAVGWGGNTAGSVSVKVEVLEGTTVLATRTLVKTFGVPWTNETLGFLPTTTQTTVRFTDVSTVTSSFDFVISGISVVGNCGLDTDGDGIPNSLDLDSDGDGCADAIEGAGTFKVGNITPAGALTGTVSLATATYGVPTQAGPGQTIGSSQNAAVQDADCVVCVAGTTAPALSVTSKTNTCPATTVDLSSITASNTPAGTTLTWHSSSPATAANRITNVSSLTAGTYYAAFFDATANCFSGTAVTQITATTVLCCSTPSVGGTAAYAGGAVCPTNNAGTITLTGQTGGVVKWQTSTDGGSTWVDLPNSAANKYYSFYNAVNGQQYRAVLNTGGAGCPDAYSNPATITTSPTACNSTTCDKIAGTIAFTATPAVSGSNFTNRVVLTNASGLIQYISAPGSTSVTGVAAGDYFVYQITFDNTVSPLPIITAGINLSAIGGACVVLSNQLAIKVCPPAPDFVFNCANATSSGAFIASGTAGQTGTLNLLITVTAPGAVTLLVSGTGFLSSPVPYATTLTAGQTSISVPITYDGAGAAGTRTLTVTSANATGTCSPTVVVSVLDIPCTPVQPGIASASAASIQTGNTASFALSQYSPASAAVTWTIVPSAGVSQASGTGTSTGNITFLIAGNYSIIYNIVNSSVPIGCNLSANAFATTRLVVTSPPTLCQTPSPGIATVAPSSAAIPVNGTASVGLTGGTPNTNVSWMVIPSAGVSQAAGTGASTGTLTFTTAGLYQVVYTIYNAGDGTCLPVQNTAEAMISVGLNPCFPHRPLPLSRRLPTTHPLRAMR